MITKTFYILLLSALLLNACDNATEISQNKNLTNKSSEKETEINTLSLNNTDEYTAAFNAMKDAWEKEFINLKEYCDGVYPIIKNYGLFMTEEQILLSSRYNNDNLTCENYNKADTVVTERRCSSPAFAKPIKEIFLGKVSENSPFRAFQIEVGLGDNLNSGEADVLFSNFKTNYKTDDDDKWCKSKTPFQIDGIQYPNETVGSISFDFSRGKLSFGPMKNYVTIFSHPYTDFILNYNRSIYDKKYEAEKNAAEKNNNLKTF